MRRPPARRGGTWREEPGVAGHVGCAGSASPLCLPRGWDRPRSEADPGSGGEDGLDPRRFRGNSIFGCRANGGVARGSAAAARIPAAIESTSSGSTRTPHSGVMTSGGPPTRVATTGRAHASPSNITCPCGSSRLGMQRTSWAWISAMSCSSGRRPVKRTPAGAEVRSSSPSGPPPTTVSEPRSSFENASSRRPAFFRSFRLPTKMKRGPSPSVRGAGLKAPVGGSRRQGGVACDSRRVWPGSETATRPLPRRPRDRRLLRVGTLALPRTWRRMAEVRPLGDRQAF